MNKIEAFVSRLKNTKRNGKGWVACCPAHEDRTPSLSVSQGDDGRILLKCFAGCKPEAIVAALGMSMADLMPESKKPVPRKTKPNQHKRYFTTVDEAIAQLERQHGKPARRWEYETADDELVGVVCRWNLPNDKKTIRPVSRDNRGRWYVGAMPEKRPLYGLPELQFRSNERVFVCEGEKAADAAHCVGLLATTSSGGSQAAAKTDWNPLAGRDVAILPDNDDAGAKYAKDVARILSKLEPPATVRIVELPGLPDGGDIVEFVAARRAAKLTDVAIGAEVQAWADEADTVGVPKDGPVIVCLADVEPRTIEWLWPSRIPMGRLSLLVGRPGIGKSFLTTDLAARVSTGSPWPDGTGTATKGSVIFISCEDDPGDTIRPRLDAHYADVRNIHLLAGVNQADDDGRTRETMFTLADIATLEQTLKTVSNCRLVVVDPIGSYIGGKTDANQDNSVRGILAPVAKLAEKYGPAVLVVSHRRKSAGGTADEMSLGSVGFVGIARTVYHLSSDPQDKKRRLWLPGKNNLAAEGDGMAFTIAGEPPRLQWERDPVRMTADEALAAEMAGGKPGPEPEATESATAWLLELLHHRPMPVGNKTKPEPGSIRDEAKQAGMSWATVRRAAEALGIAKEKSSFTGGWQWRLPKGPAQGAQDIQDTPLYVEPEHLGNLGVFDPENAVSEGGSDGVIPKVLRFHETPPPDEEPEHLGDDWGEL